jgi:hypothetical protein
MSALHLITMNISYPDKVFSGITKLVEHGADVNAKYVLNALKISSFLNVALLSRTHINETPLHCAILNRNYNAFKALLELGADVNARGFGLMTRKLLPRTHMKLICTISFALHTEVSRLRFCAISRQSKRWFQSCWLRCHSIFCVELELCR